MGLFSGNHLVTYGGVTIRSCICLTIFLHFYSDQSVQQLQTECENLSLLASCFAHQLLKQSVTDEKPLVDRLNKTGSVLVKLVGDEEAEKVHEILENVATRFDSLKNDVRERTNTLDDALLQTSQV